MLKRITLFILLFLCMYVVYTFTSTGYFRTIEPYFDGEIITKVPVAGAEDIMASLQDSFAIVSATDRANEDLEGNKKDGLYLIDLKANDFTPIPLTTNFKEAFHPHGISYFQEDSIYHVKAVNHTDKGHTIEVFELIGKSLRHVETLRHSSMISPNDLIMIDKSRFYFTNDHKYTKGIGKLVEEYLGLAISNVVYFDGESYAEVADGIAYANGINYDEERRLMFVASPRKFLVKVYSVQTDGSLDFIEDIPCRTGVDNIEFDSEGNLWIGAHPNLLGFSAYSKGRKEISPSEIIKIIYRGKGDYSIEQVYLSRGEDMSGSTVAATFGDLILVGNVMDEAFLVLRRD